MRDYSNFGNTLKSIDDFYDKNPQLNTMTPKDIHNWENLKEWVNKINEAIVSWKIDRISEQEKDIAFRGILRELLSQKDKEWREKVEKIKKGFSMTTVESNGRILVELDGENHTVQGFIDEITNK